MMNQYKIEDQFTVRGKQVLSFDRDINIYDLGSLKIKVNGKSIGFYITHNPRWILTEITESLIGKIATFEK